MIRGCCSQSETLTCAADRTRRNGLLGLAPNLKCAYDNSAYRCKLGGRDEFTCNCCSCLLLAVAAILVSPHGSGAKSASWHSDSTGQNIPTLSRAEVTQRERRLGSSNAMLMGFLSTGNVAAQGTEHREISLTCSNFHGPGTPVQQSQTNAMMYSNPRGEPASLRPATISLSSANSQPRIDWIDMFFASRPPCDSLRTLCVRNQLGLGFDEHWSLLASQIFSSCIISSGLRILISVSVLGTNVRG